MGSDVGYRSFTITSPRRLDRLLKRTLGGPALMQRDVQWQAEQTLCRRCNVWCQRLDVPRPRGSHHHPRFYEFWIPSSYDGRNRTNLQGSIALP
jgi:hypothetical protein